MKGSDIPFREYLKDRLVEVSEICRKNWNRRRKIGWTHLRRNFSKRWNRRGFTKAYKLPTIRAFLHQGTIRERVQLREIGEEMMNFYRDYPLHQKDLNNRSNRNWRSWGG